MTLNRNGLEHTFNTIEKVVDIQFCKYLYDPFSQKLSPRKQKELYAEYTKSLEIKKYFNTIADIIKVDIVNDSYNNFDLYGASGVKMLSEKKKPSAVAHLEESDISLHIYPESNPSWISMRICTCGDIKPIMALGYLLGVMDPDGGVVSYYLKGFRHTKNGILFEDEVNPIRMYVDPNELNRYNHLGSGIPRGVSVMLVKKDLSKKQEKQILGLVRGMAGLRNS